MSQNNWFDLWGVLDHSSVWDEIVPAIKVYEQDLTNKALSFGARICALWIRHVSCHEQLDKYSKDRLAEDLQVDPSTINRWLRELTDNGCLDEFKGLWPTNEAAGQVYFVQSINGGPIKIGKAIDVARRLAQIQTGYPEQLQVIGIIENGGVEAEQALHKRFATYRIRGEWFLASDELVEYIRSL